MTDLDSLQNHMFWLIRNIEGQVSFFAVRHELEINTMFSNELRFENLKFVEPLNYTNNAISLALNCI